MHAPPFIPQDTGAGSVSRSCPRVNVGMNERLISLGTGGMLLLNSLVGPRRSRPLSFLVAAGLFYRGLTGHCHAYEMLGVDSAQRENAEDERLGQAEPD
jgi:hypothetical protein